MNEIMQKKSFITKKQLITFGIVFSIFLGIIGYINFRKDNELTYHLLWGVAILNFVTTVTYPEAIKPIYRAALFIAHILGWINSRLLLGLIFYLLFTPISLLMKIFGKDLLDRKIDKNAPTYWKMREKTGFDKDRYLKQF